HVFNVLNAKPFKIAFFEFIELIIIPTYGNPIQMLKVMPFDYLKLCDSDDSTFRVDILSRFPVGHKSIELLTFTPPMRDSPESMFVIADRYLTPHCTSSNIIECAVAELVQFINAHQSVLLVFVLVDESSRIGVSEIFHTPLDDDASCKHSQKDIKSKAFIDSEIGQLSLHHKKQHVFNVLNAKPFEIAFFEFIELIIIPTYGNPIQMLGVMPFDYLKLCDSDDSTFRVDILSRFPVDHKSIELLTFTPPMRDSPESMFVIADRYLTPHCTR
nr:hypothetical protein [Tanacetum cinerariifolium]